MIVTTAGRTNEEMIRYTKAVAKELHCSYKERRKQSVAELQQKYNEDVLVVGWERLQIYPKDGQPSFFFHPNSATFRVKRLMRGDQDPFIETAQLKKGMTLLDCTLGLASDSIVGSYVVGKSGNVTGIEQNAFVAYLAQKGLQQWKSGILELDEAMRRIEVHGGHHLDFLRNCPDNAYDVVYFDPMFEVSILESDGIQGIKAFAWYEDLLEEAIFHGKRVATHRVILKDHYQSKRFGQYGFHQIIRKTSKFHFGYIQI